MTPPHQPITANPIFVRLAGRGRWVPPAYVFVLALAAGAIVTARLALPRREYSLQPLPMMVEMLAGWVILAILPPVMAAAATLVVAREAVSEDNRLLRLTNLSASDCATGYIAGVLYRLRLPLIGMAVLMPLLAPGMVLVSPFGRTLFYLLNCPPNDVRCAPFRPAPIPVGAVVQEALLLHLIIWGLILMAVSAAVAVGLKWRHYLSALNAVAVLLVGVIIVRLWPLWEWDPWYLRFPQGHLAIAAALWALALILMRLARRWA